VSDRVLRFPDRTWDELEGSPQPLRNAAHQAIFHLLEEPVPTLADPFPDDDPLQLFTCDLAWGRACRSYASPHCP